MKNTNDARAIVHTGLGRILLSSLLLFAVASVAQASPTRACFQVFQSPEQFESLVATTRQATTIHALTSKSERMFSIHPRAIRMFLPPVLKSTLDRESGILHFEIKTRAIGGRLQYADIHARALFHMMMESLEGHDVRGIQGMWFLEYDPRDELQSDAPDMKTNTNQYLDFVRKGDAPEVAARKTWTGSMAGLYGFTKVESIEKQELFDGTYLVVNFVRP